MKKKAIINYVDFFELNENLIYYFNFSLFYKSASNSMYFLYIIKSNYSKIIEVKKNKLEFDNLPVIDGLYILLDVSSTPTGYKIIFEYDYEWYYKNFEADGYEIDDINTIDSLYDEKQQNLKNEANIRIPLIVTKENCYEKYLFKKNNFKNSKRRKRFKIFVI